MKKHLILIPILIFLSIPLFATYTTKGEHLVAVNFSGGPSHYIGFSSTRVDSRNHTPTAIDSNEVSFQLNSNGDRIAQFYIYWKLYEVDQVTITLSELNPLKNNDSTPIELSYVSTHEVNKKTLESYGRNGNSTASYEIYKDSESSNSYPRIDSRLVTLKLDLDDDTMEAIGASENQLFNTATIKLELTTT